MWSLGARGHEQDRGRCSDSRGGRVSEDLVKKKKMHLINTGGGKCSEEDKQADVSGRLPFRESCCLGH